ncbi:MAG: hypothetical protein AB1631_32750 [Acidobacteriota bacterium]
MDRVLALQKLSSASTEIEPVRPASSDSNVCSSQTNGCSSQSVQCGRESLLNW